MRPIVAGCLPDTTSNVTSNFFQTAWKKDSPSGNTAKTDSAEFVESAIFKKKIWISNWRFQCRDRLYMGWLEGMGPDDAGHLMEKCEKSEGCR